MLYRCVEDGWRSAKESRVGGEENGRNILMMGQIRETTGGIRGIQ